MPSLAKWDLQKVAIVHSLNNNNQSNATAQPDLCKIQIVCTQNINLNLVYADIGTDWMTILKWFLKKLDVTVRLNGRLL
jgi:hypothetical protein